MKLNNIDEKMTKTWEDLTLHMFTDGTDMYFPYTRNGTEGYGEALEKANKLKDEWIKKGVENIRIYDVRAYNDPRDGEICEDEDCIFSIGDFPY